MNFFKKFSSKKEDNKEQIENQQNDEQLNTSDESCENYASDNKISDNDSDVQSAPEGNSATPEIPEDVKKVIEEAQRIAKNPDAQIRFVIEHKILPEKIVSDPIYVITSIIADKGNYINNFFKGLYTRNKLEEQYTPEDFAVSVPFEVEGVKVVKIDMPEKNLFPSLCKRIYIAYNEHFTKYLYITVEKINDETYKMGAWIDGEHEEYGQIDNNEEQLLSEIIADEEIAEGNYSEIINKLMVQAKPDPNGLLSNPEEIVKHSKLFMSALMQSQKYKQENKRDEALKLIKEVIRKEAVKYTDTPDSEYHCFRNSFDVLLYANLYHPYNPQNNKKKQLIAMQVDLSSAYLVYGVMMLEQKQYDKAIDILWKAVEANPVNVQLIFALADAYKGKRYLKTYYELMKKAHICAVKKLDIARIYRNFSYYYTQIKEYDTAAALCFASKYFDSDPRGYDLTMKQIKEESGEEFAEMTLDEIKKKLFSAGIAWGAKELAISVINMLNQQFTQANNQAGIKMCQELIKDVTLEN